MEPKVLEILEACPYVVKTSEPTKFFDMAQLFLYLTFALIATVSGDQNLRVNVDNALNHSITFVPQDLNTDGSQSRDHNDPDDTCWSQTLPAKVSRLFSHSFTLSVPSSHTSYRPYSVRAPPVFLS